MELSNKARAVLAHVVVDPDAWLAHVVEYFGEELAAMHLEAKIERHRASYEAAKLDAKYLTRAQQEAHGRL